jgi:hypothetical protein
VTVYQGSATSITTAGVGQALSTADSSKGFGGFAVHGAVGGSADGDESVEVLTKGVVELTVTGVDNLNDVGTTVYATDDNTFTLTASGAIAIGKVKEVLSTSTGRCLVAFEATIERSI